VENLYFGMWKEPKLICKTNAEMKTAHNHVKLPTLHLENVIDRWNYILCFATNLYVYVRKYIT
jgi:hypothetical protein